MKRIVACLLAIVCLAACMIPKATNTYAAQTNYAIDATYKILKEGVEQDPTYMFLLYDKGETDWADVNCTRLNDGIVSKGAELDANGFLSGTTVQLVGTGAQYTFVFEFDKKATNIEKIVFRNVRNGVPNNNNRGFDTEVYPFIWVSDDGKNYDLCIGSCDNGVPVPGAPMISDQFDKDKLSVENFDYTYTLDKAVDCKYMKIDVCSPVYVLSLDEVEIWGTPEAQSNTTDNTTSSKPTVDSDVIGEWYHEGSGFTEYYTFNADGSAHCRLEQNGESFSYDGGLTTQNGMLYVYIDVNGTKSAVFDNLEYIALDDIICITLDDSTNYYLYRGTPDDVTTVPPDDSSSYPQEVDKELLGVWYEADNGRILYFFDDSTVGIYYSSSQVVIGMYSADGSELIIYEKDDDTADETHSYGISGDMLIINNKEIFMRYTETESTDDSDYSYPDYSSDYYDSEDTWDSSTDSYDSYDYFGESKGETSDIEYDDKDEEEEEEEEEEEDEEDNRDYEEENKIGKNTFVVLLIGGFIVGIGIIAFIFGKIFSGKNKQ